MGFFRVAGVACAIACALGTASCGGRKPKPVSPTPQDGAGGIEAPAKPAAKEDPKRLPRSLFFGIPDAASVRMSPDGTRLAWLGPAADVPEIMVRDLASDDTETRIVTGPTAFGRGTVESKSDTGGVLSLFWAQDSRHVLHVPDPGNGELHLHSVDVTTGESRDLTPYSGARMRVVRLSPSRPKEVAVAMDDRVPKTFDLYSVDVASGARVLLHRNTEAFTTFVLDASFRLRFGRRERDDGGAEVDRAADRGTFTPVMGFSAEDASVLDLLGTDAQGNVLGLVDARERPFAGLFQHDVRTRKRKLLAEDARLDVADTFVDPKSGKVQAASFAPGRTRWAVVDKDVAKDFATLRATLRGDFVVRDRSTDDSRWLVEETLDAAPVRWFVYDRRAKKPTVTLVATSKRSLERAALSRTYPKSWKAKDGVEVRGLLTLPREADALGDGRAGTAVPLVIVPADLPFARHVWGFRAVDQWLASRGYAVLAVNSRGTRGFGKAFLRQGAGQFDGMEATDLVDAAEWAFREGVSKKDRVAIFGVGYGGARALAALAKAPDAFACAVTFDAPVDLATWFGAVDAPFLTHPKNVVTLFGSNPTTESGRAALGALSPKTLVGTITKPFFFSARGSDRKSEAAEVDAFAEAAKKAGAPATIVRFPEATTHFLREEDEIARAAMADAYLADCLGGVYAPYGKDFRWSKFEVIAGGDRVPGLAAAIERKGY
ncbi:MAG: prolyl oligopeptidase family serine peptidase [Polyangiaceae bacterium]